MIFGYARVSTKGQAANGNFLDSQLEDLKKAGAEEIYTDTFTGTTMSRPEFEKLRMKLRRGDTLIITKLDRQSMIKNSSTMHWNYSKQNPIQK